MIDTLSAAGEAMSGRFDGTDRGFSGVSIDTRSLRSDELFFAISGPNFDGHDYVDAAFGKGAAGAVVSRDPAPGCIVVDDTRRALGRLGRAWRRDSSARVVGVTGSNGKTTLKEMIGSCLARRGRTLTTAGNLNNDLGVPLMLLRLERGHEFAVIEMGANHAGEIAYLTTLALPDVVVLNNAGPAHLEGFGSLDGVARAKGEILSGDPRPQCAVLNADDAYFDYWSGLVEDIDSLSFGFAESADVRASGLQSGPAGSGFRLHLPDETAEVQISLPGEHNVRNACAAAAVCWRLGLGADDIAAGLSAVRPVDGRLQVRPGRGGASIYDDSYNANPESVLAAARVLGALDGTTIMVLGDMLELGPDAAVIHERTGAGIAAAGVDALYATGGLARHAAAGFGDAGRWFADVDALSASLSSQLDDRTHVLVKGSRSMRMERVVDALGDGEGR